MKSLTCILLLVIGVPNFADDRLSAEGPVLPKVLIIGDSISLGYTPLVSQLFDGIAEVVHHPGNAQHTGTGLEMMDEWIGDTKWEVIQFNWGLWDLCYRHPESQHYGNRDKINGTITTDLEQYGLNLEILVTRLIKTNAQLVWANTTIVPEGEAGRFVGDDERYNEIAAQVMRKHEIQIIDLHDLTSQFPSDMFVAPGDVHFTKDGYALIAEEVAKQISSALAEASLSR